MTAVKRPAVRVNQDRACLHADFDAVVTVNRIAEEGQVPTAYNADITVSCADCGEPFRWTGLRAGLSYSHPMVSVNEREMHAPLRPASADPDFGMGLPGFAISVVDGRPDTEGGDLDGRG